MGNHIELPQDDSTAEKEEALAILHGRTLRAVSDDDKPRGPPSPDPISKTMITLAYDAAGMEQQLKIEAMIESRITKIMARLIALKEYERLYGEKLLPPPPSASD